MAAGGESGRRTGRVAADRGRVPRRDAALGADMVPWPGALTVRFEDLRREGVGEISRISAHLGLSPDQHRDAALYRRVYGQGRTYTGRHSDWRETFGPLSNAAWASHGGPELLEDDGIQMSNGMLMMCAVDLRFPAGRRNDHCTVSTFG
jgi:hypothetical protein